ncbi:hypothetical protein D9F64_24250 [Escherichia coli]|nr:hypothetical protein [Escherichia coli]EEW2521536.1 hypothetical protein [Escherichia coli]
MVTICSLKNILFFKVRNATTQLVLVLIVNIVYVDNFNIKKNHQVYEQIQISLAIEKESTYLGICTEVNIFFIIKYKALHKYLIFCA